MASRLYRTILRQPRWIPATGALACLSASATLVAASGAPLEPTAQQWLLLVALVFAVAAVFLFTLATGISKHIVEPVVAAALVRHVREANAHPTYLERDEYERKHAKLAEKTDEALVILYRIEGRLGNDEKAS